MASRLEDLVTRSQRSVDAVRPRALELLYYCHVYGVWDMNGLIIRFETLITAGNEIEDNIEMCSLHQELIP